MRRRCPERAGRPRHGHSARFEPDGRVVVEALTEWFAKLLGYAPEEMAGPDRWKILIHTEDAAQAEESVRRVLAAETVEGEIRSMARDGRVVWLRYRHRPVKDQHGRVVRVYGAAQDVTRHREAEQSRRQSEERERARVEELRAMQEQLRIVTDSMAAPVCTLQPRSPVPVGEQALR